MEYLDPNTPGFWISLGLLLLIVELLFLGFGTIVLLFAGIGALITGGLMAAGILPEGWVAPVASFSIMTTVTTAALWRPMKRLQENSTPQSEQKSDFDGLEFVLQQDASLTQPGKYRYSGVDWRVEPDADNSNETFNKGDQVVVTSVDVGVFRVRKKS